MFSTHTAWLAPAVICAAAFAASPARLPHDLGKGAPDPSAPSAPKKVGPDASSPNADRKGGEDRARRLFEDVCSYCHELARVQRQHLTAEEWRGFIKGMVDEGPPLTDEEFTMIVDYLGTHFGPDSPEASQ
ncbi:MAG TPA: cytochrome c [Bryobacteraceae bacterium]|nr:cytochrome c [Bryobacteraceae bacterium]